MRSFSFSNFNKKQRKQSVKDFSRIALFGLFLATALCLVSPFAGLWVATASVMTGCLAGAVKFSDHVVRSKAEYDASFSRATKIRERIANLDCICLMSKNNHRHNHARGYRRGASSKTSTGGNSSDGGSDPDQGEPPDPDHPSILTHHLLTHLKTFSKTQEKNSFTSLRRVLRSLGCCCLPTHQRFEEVVA